MRAEDLPVSGDVKQAIMAAKQAMCEKKWPAAVDHWRRAVAGCGRQIPAALQEAVSALAAYDAAVFRPVCNLCGCPLFKDARKRKNVQCLSCLSLERTRLMGLYLEKLAVPAPDSRVFHIAPERGIYEKISAVVAPENYDVVDLNPSQYRFAPQVRAFDLCRDTEKLPSDTFDLILHSHVFEHIVCDYRVALKHLHRALKPGGWHVCVIPFMHGRFEECLTAISGEEAAVRFGNPGHVRRFGHEDAAETLGQSLLFNADFDAARDFSEETLWRANIPRSCWKGLTPNTVLCLRKEDCLL